MYRRYFYTVSFADSF